MTIPSELTNIVDLDILLQVSTGVCLILFLLVVDITTNSRRIINSAKFLLHSENEKLKKIEYQFSILKAHAPTYINSLGKKGSDLLQELDTIIVEREESLSQLHFLIREGEVDELISLLQGEKEKSREVKWSSRADSIIRDLGNKIFKASNLASEAGLPKVKSKREGTQLSLSLARIIPSQKDLSE
jgi:SUMO ligase MMS21 Smc5/6 complex component